MNYLKVNSSFCYKLIIGIITSFLASNVFASTTADGAQGYVKMFHNLMGGLLFYAITWGAVLQSTDYFKKKPVISWLGSWFISQTFFIGYVVYLDYLSYDTFVLSKSLVANSVSVYGLIGFVLGIPYTLGFFIGWLSIKVIHKRAR